MQSFPNSAPSSSPTAGEGSRDLFGAVLASVSRSFYLTIRVLPPPVRRPVAVAYLLARMSDTVADEASVPAARRLGILREFVPALTGGEDASLLSSLAILRDQVSNRGERTLLEQAGALFALFRALTPEDREEVTRVLKVILRGQEQDLERFPAHRQGEVAALANAEELDDYTFRVAGCVGEFWTRLCFRHLSRYATRDEAAMIRLGIGFGKGLQLVNILRDAPADLAAGRCYLPADELEEAGASPATLLTQPAPARPVVDRWRERANGYLEDARLYLEAVRPWRLRLACFLPWAIGVRTLALMTRKPPLESQERIKVSRREIRRLLVWGIFVAVGGNFVLRKFAR